MLNASGQLILPEFLAESFTQPALPETPMTPTDALDVAGLIEKLLQSADGKLHDQVIAAVERILFAKVLEHTHGNQAKAAQVTRLEPPFDSCLASLAKSSVWRWKRRRLKRRRKI